MNLVIVESPTKAKTIGKFLGAGHKVESSFGHIRDLPVKDIGIDIEHDFRPTYAVPIKAKKTVANLKKLASKAEQVILATDEDREGEAIAWHLAEALGLDKDKTGRIVFHEITNDAIADALKSPRRIEMELVDAQQARRILDRLVGYELSPFLWKKVARGLSAGRVQSVAVRLIVEREKEIRAFRPEEYWTIEADFIKRQGDQRIITAKLNKISGRTVDKLEIKNENEAKKIIAGLEGADYAVAEILRKKVIRKAPRPFTTSTLQQTANRWLGFSAKQTMTIAQKLYEQGLITYMRTDSMNLSAKFLDDAKNFLTNTYGAAYALDKPRLYKTKSKGAQEAHEAIRPTEANKLPSEKKDKLDNGQYRLYKLIWERSLASQMPDAIFDATAVDIDAAGTSYRFRATGQVMKYDGYLKIYPEASTEVDLPELDKSEKLGLKALKPAGHFTKPPARYSDAGLVKAMEKYGIGRPSTYAPTIATIIARNYVERDDNKKLAPTEIAFVVNDLLAKHFSDIVDYEFTANLENRLDAIAMGEVKWQPVISDFYQPFHSNLEKKYNEINKKDIMPEEESNEICDKCGAPMIIKTGRYGKFYACSAYPDCKNIKGVNGATAGGQSQEKSEELKKLEEENRGKKCDKCGADMAVKTGRYGPFLACTAYPKCKNIVNLGGGQSSTGIACPACGQGEIVKKHSRKGVFYACNKYPDCKNAYWAKPTGDKCPGCGALLVENKKGAKCSNRDCGYEK